MAVETSVLTSWVSVSHGGVSVPFLFSLCAFCSAISFQMPMKMNFIRNKVWRAERGDRKTELEALEVRTGGNTNFRSGMPTSSICLTSGRLYHSEF